MKKLVLSARVHPQVLDRLAAAAEIAGARYDYTSAELIRFAITDTIQRYTGEAGIEPPTTPTPPKPKHSPTKDRIETAISTYAEPARTQLTNLYAQYKSDELDQTVLTELTQSDDNPDLAERATELLTLISDNQPKGDSV